MIPVICLGKVGWTFNDYSILAGQQYRVGLRPLQNHELQYDNYSTSCTRQSHYLGLGLNYSFNDNIKEFGIKAMYNPTRINIKVTRTIKFYPYFFGQGNFIQTKYTDPISAQNKQINKYGLRPGIGLSGNVRDNKVLNIRTSLQVGYNILFDNAESLKKPLTLEIKVGIGINSKKIKRNRPKEEELKMQEDQ